MNIAIVGATGNVGRKIIEVLERKNFSVTNLYLLASAKSSGVKIKFKDREIEVSDLENFDFSKADITFFSAGGKISEKYVSAAAKHTVVIDNSSYFRMDPDVPLIVPQVNSKEIKNMKKNILANPNCSTAQLVIVLKNLNDNFKIKRLVISTYQSTSGAGKKPMDELLNQTKKALESKEIKSENFTKQIAFNAIPHIDKFSTDGYTKEEIKMIQESNKILGSNIDITATCVRIPVLVSHAESVNVEFENEAPIDKVREILNQSPGCKVIDDRNDGGYITPVEAEGKNETFISRIRRDNSKKNAINMWRYRIVIFHNYFLMYASAISTAFKAAPLKKFSESMVGKFFIIGFIWSYLFQILSEIRHWFWDMGYGFELRTTKITGVIVILGSFILTIALYLLSGVLI